MSNDNSAFNRMKELASDEGMKKAMQAISMGMAGIRVDVPAEQPTETDIATLRNDDLPDFGIIGCPTVDTLARYTRICMVAPDASAELIASLQKEKGTLVVVEGTPEAEFIARTMQETKPIKITNPYPLIPKQRPEYDNRRHKRAKLKPKGKKKYGW